MELALYFHIALQKSRGIAIKFTKLKDKIIEEYSVYREIFGKTAARFIRELGLVARIAPTQGRELSGILDPQFPNTTFSFGL